LAEALPTHSEEDLQRLDADALVRTLMVDEDRAPRTLIELCARRGGEMLDAVQAVLDKDYYWGDDQADGEWWLRFHAVMILGLMNEERAGVLLVEYLRRIDETGDDTLAEWLGGHWPRLFRNKPAAALAPLRELAQDRNAGAYTRAQAADVVMACAQWTDAPQLERAIAWAAKIAFDDREHLAVRELVGSTLLNFARPEHRRKLEQLADLQPESAAMFDRKEIGAIYLARGASHEWDWEDFQDPWAFYDTDQIEERQRRWAEADDALADEPALSDEPYVRPTPKVGRNDPCPCRSGKKYKKCCGA
jgi:hypothetical protein